MIVIKWLNPQREVYIEKSKRKIDIKDGEKVSILSTFYAHFFCQYFGAKKLQSQNVTREKMHNLLLYEKHARKMLMKLTPAGGNTMDEFYLIVKLVSNLLNCFNF